MASDVDITNSALDLLGEPVINALTDDTPGARIANRTFQRLSDAVLRAHPWNFAMFQASIPADATAPTWKYSAAYTWPSVPWCLRIWEVENPSRLEYKILGRKIHTDLGAPLKIQFIGRVTNYTDPLFNEALAARCALEWAEKLTKEPAVRKDMAELYAALMPESRSIDGQEGTPEVAEHYTWIAVRG